MEASESEIVKSAIIKHRIKLQQVQKKLAKRSEKSKKIARNKNKNRNDKKIANEVASGLW